MVAPCRCRPQFFVLATILPRFSISFGHISSKKSAVGGSHFFADVLLAQRTFARADGRDQKSTTSARCFEKYKAPFACQEKALRL